MDIKNEISVVILLVHKLAKCKHPTMIQIYEKTIRNILTDTQSRIKKLETCIDNISAKATNAVRLQQLHKELFCINSVMDSCKREGTDREYSNY